MSMVERFNTEDLADRGEVLHGDFVLASDYDALAASVEHYAALAANWQHEAELDLARIRELEALASDLREDYLHLMRRVRGAYELLSGEFYAEALGELDDACSHG